MRRRYRRTLRHHATTHSRSTILQHRIVRRLVSEQVVRQLMPRLPGSASAAYHAPVDQCYDIYSDDALTDESIPETVIQAELYNPLVTIECDLIPVRRVLRDTQSYTPLVTPETVEPDYATAWHLLPDDLRVVPDGVDEIDYIKVYMDVLAKSTELHSCRRLKQYLKMAILTSYVVRERWATTRLCRSDFVDDAAEVVVAWFTNNPPD